MEGISEGVLILEGSSKRVGQLVFDSRVEGSTSGVVSSCGQFFYGCIIPDIVKLYQMNITRQGRDNSYI